MVPLDEKSVIRAFREGNEFAFVSLYNRYKGQVYAFCLKMLGDQDQAKDALQDTFLRIYENRERLLKTDAFKSWVYTIARNQCLNIIRIRARKTKLSSLESSHEKIIESQTPFSHLEKNEQARMVRMYLASLKTDYREALILREYQGLSYEEIAIITESSISAVKSRIFKARRKLASYLAPIIEEKPIVEEREYERK